MAVAFSVVEINNVFQPSIIVHADELRVVAGNEDIDSRSDRAHLSARCSLRVHQIYLSLYPGV